MEPISLTWINKETKLHNKINIITRQKAKKMSSENTQNSNQTGLPGNNHATTPTPNSPKIDDLGNLESSEDLVNLNNSENLEQSAEPDTVQSAEPDLKEDNLEDDIIATKLFKIIDFYPAGNIIEACIYSNEFANGKVPRGFPERNYPKYAIIQIWKKALINLLQMKEWLNLSLQEGLILEKTLEKVEQQEYDYKEGIDKDSEKIRHELPEKVINALPEVIAKILDTNIITINEYGLEVATNMGLNSEKNNAILIYRTISEKNKFDNFGIQLKPRSKSFSKELIKELINPKNFISSWDKRKVMEFIDNWLTQNIKSVTNAEHIEAEKLLQNLEKEGFHEQAKEWISNIPPNIRRSLYKIEKPLIKQAKKPRGMREVPIKNHRKQVFISKDENYKIDCDLLVEQYNRVPINDLEESGIFDNSGPLLKIEILKQMRDLEAANVFFPRIFNTGGYRLLCKKLTLIAHSPEEKNQEEEIKDLEKMYDEIFMEARKNKVKTLTLPILGAENSTRKNIKLNKLVKIAKTKIGDYLTEEKNVIIIILTSNEKVRQLLLEDWELISRETKELKEINPDKIKEQKLSTKKVNLVGEKLIKFEGIIKNKPVLCLLDAGSEISIVNQRVVDNMIEGIDYDRIGDLNLIGPDNNPINNTGRIRIKKHSGLKIQENVQ